MIDLKKVLKEKPDCLSSRATFKAVLLDHYPNEKRAINILTILFESGIASRIAGKRKDSSEIDTNEMVSIIAQLENDYGIMAKYAQEGICIWANACDVTIRESVKKDPVTVQPEPIKHAPIVDPVVVIGNTSDYETTVVDGYVQITKFRGFDEKEIIIPNIIDGKEVRIIGKNAFLMCKGIERIIVSEGITEIHNGAFSGCLALKSIVLPSTLKSLGNTTEEYSRDLGVFQNSALESIVLPESLIYLGAHAFRNTKLRKINLPNSVSSIQDHCFDECNLLEVVELPDSLKYIGEYAFSCTAIYKINIPISVYRIDRYAFSNCGNLSQVLLHEGLKDIGKGVFENCKTLHKITLPQSVTAIDGAIFDITGWYQPYDRRRNGWSTRNKHPSLIIYCYAGSYGLEYARQEGYEVRNAAQST